MRPLGCTRATSGHTSSGHEPCLVDGTGIEAGGYLPARRCQRVALSIFLCFFLRMRLRRFLILIRTRRSSHISSTSLSVHSVVVGTVVGFRVDRRPSGGLLAHISMLSAPAVKGRPKV